MAQKCTEIYAAIPNDGRNRHLLTKKGHDLLEREEGRSEFWKVTFMYI